MKLETNQNRSPANKILVHFTKEELEAVLEGTWVTKVTQCECVENKKCQIK